MSELSDISYTAIGRIEREDRRYKFNIAVAAALATALDCSVSDLFDDEELSWDVGRPPHTGTPIKSTRINSQVECPACHLLVPANVGCEEHGRIAATQSVTA